MERLQVSSISLLFQFDIIYPLKRRSVFKEAVPICQSSYRLGSSPSQEKSRERRTWDIGSISNVTCKNWRENLLLLSTRKSRLRRKNPTVNFGALQMSQVRLSLLLSHILAPFFTTRVHRYFQPLARRT
jgi:hypothetical protein